MGLDWRPMGKPKPGFEERYVEIFNIITGRQKQALSTLDKLKGKKLKTQEELLQEWFDNSIQTYETIKAPRVGRDKPADDWLKEQYEETDKSVPREQFIKDYEGYYVIELAEELDGVPMYIAMEQDRNVFRGQFIDDCKEIIGEDLHADAWNTKLAPETLAYGNKLMQIADRVAKEHNLQYLKEQRTPPDADEDSMESKLHILYSAAKWLIFYGRNGHGYEADF